ncbi:MAG: ParA family protein [Actinomycetota bacterium]
MAGRGRTICIANQKGGVAKTTTAVNLAAALALRGHRILVVDIDPQANATTGLGLDHRSLATSAYDLMLGDGELDDIIVETAIKGLDCVPSTPDLAGAEVELVSEMEREQRLGDALKPVSSRYDLIFLDCPPSLGLLTVNALAAAQDLIVPVQCEYYALEGLGQLLGNAERVRRALNPGLRIAGFLMTMYDARTKLSSQVADEVRSHFGDLVFGTVIPRSVRLSEAPSFGEPVLTLDPSSRGSIAYRLLAAEVEARYRLEPHVPPPPPPSSPPPAPTAPPATPSSATPPAATPPAATPPDRPAIVRSAPGPGGRGYGTTTQAPKGLDTAWPPRNVWDRPAGATGSDRETEVER